MDIQDLGRLHLHYARMSDDELGAALNCGPDAYRSSEVWKIIVEEAGRRHLPVPTQAELDEHEAALARADLANRGLLVPWGWRLYIALSRAAVVLTGLYYMKHIVALIYDLKAYDGWQLDLRDDIVALGVVCLVAWMRHRHVVAIERRFNNSPVPLNSPGHG